MIDKLRARLIEDWRKAWRYWSVQVSLFGAALSAAWTQLPADTRASIPGAQWIGFALFMLVLASRLIQQGKTDA